MGGGGLREYELTEFLTGFCIIVSQKDTCGFFFKCLCLVNLDYLLVLKCVVLHGHITYDHINLFLFL